MHLIFVHGLLYLPGVIMYINNFFLLFKNPHPTGNRLTAARGKGGGGTGGRKGKGLVKEHV